MKLLLRYVSIPFLDSHLSNYTASDKSTNIPSQTYTVEFARTGEPLRGHIVGRLKSNNKRFLANHGDENTLREMASGTKEVVGRSGYVSRDPEKKRRGLFSFDESRSRL